MKKSAPFALGYTPLADGCFRNTSRLFLAEDGNYYALEWTPTLNEEGESRELLIKKIKTCTLAGGGWQVPTREEILTLASSTTYSPATPDELREDTKEGWYITSDEVVWSSGFVWFIDFNLGNVYYNDPDYYGFARGVRRVPVSLSMGEAK